MVSIISGEPLAARAVAPSVDSSLGAKLLPGVLSVTAGSVDVISFLGLGGLFAAHITGNLVILAAHISHTSPPFDRARSLRAKTQSGHFQGCRGTSHRGGFLPVCS
jgi:hypothetical protein